MVEVSPKNAMFRVGDQEEVRCTMKDCAHTPEFSWRALEDRPMYVKTTTRGSESVLTYESVKRDHENRLICTASCGGDSKQKQATVKVYCKSVNLFSVTGNS